jgi:hypothetical protein
MKTVFFTATALTILINTGAAMADPAKRTKAITKPAPKAQVYQQVKKGLSCNPGWVIAPQELNEIILPCINDTLATPTPTEW